MGLLLVTLLNLLALNGSAQRTEPLGEEVTFTLYHHEGSASSAGNLSERITRMTDLQLPPPRKTPVKFLVHDWADSTRSPWIAQMHEAMGRKNRWHVVAVDWKTGAVADRLANLTLELIATNGVPLKRVHFIGHGAGALLAARTARRIAARSGGRIARLTALDPSPPAAALKAAAAEQLKDSATFVDVIHTNGGARGTFEPLGHVDFYPNGGRSQPGCESDANCSHNRACEFWSASMVNAHVFRAFSCKLWTNYLDGKVAKLTPQPMGIGANYCMPWGAYHLETGSGLPYVLPADYFQRSNATNYSPLARRRTRSKSTKSQCSPRTATAGR